MFVVCSIDSALSYTVSIYLQQVQVFFSGIVGVIHQTIPSITMSYSTDKNSELPFRVEGFTRFPQSLLLPTERIYK